MTLDPIAQIAVLEKAINRLENISKSIVYVEKIHSDIMLTIGLLEGMKKMLEYSAGKCKPEDQF